MERRPYTPPNEALAELNLREQQLLRELSEIRQLKQLFKDPATASKLGSARFTFKMEPQTQPVSVIQQRLRSEAPVEQQQNGGR